MRYYKFCLLIVTILSCSLDQDKKTDQDGHVLTIDVNEDDWQKEFKLSNFASKIDYVVLNSPNILISAIKDIKVFGNHIFIQDKLAPRILIYNINNGELLSRIENQGQGPGEYSNISFFDIHRASKTVHILDISTGKIFIYGFDGIFKEEITARIICRDYGVNEDGSYLFYSPDEQNEFNGNLLKPGLLHLSTNRSKLNNILPLGKEGYYPLLGAGRSLIAENNRFYLISNYTDTVYTINGDAIEEKLYFDYRHKMDEEALFNPYYDLSNAGFPILKLKPFATSEYLGYSFMYKGKALSLFYDRGKGSITTYQLLNNSLNDTPFVLNGVTAVEGDRYIGIVDEMLIDSFKTVLQMEGSDRINNAKLKEIIDAYEQSNNPVLAIATLR